MANKKTEASFTNIGTSSLFVIFIILCLSIFATLSLSGAKSDYSYSEEMAVHKAEYYEACNKSEAVLAELDTKLQAVSGESDFETIAQDAVGSELSGVAITARDGVFSWQVPISDTQALAVSVSLLSPEDGGKLYRIEKWQTVTIN